MKREIVALGASAGGIQALRAIAGSLPADLAATIVIVQHLAPQSPGYLAEILARAGPLPASFGVDGEQLEHGHIYVAPPDHHMLVTAQMRVRLSRGPKENLSRPAIDPLFRSVALACEQRAVGVILSGYLNDGASGLRSIELSGGACVVQDPGDAEVPEMPSSALRLVQTARRVPLGGLGGVIAKLVAQSIPESSPMPGNNKPRGIEIEMAFAAGKHVPVSGTPSLGQPSALTCPDCHGTLFHIDTDSPLQRFRCHTGHAFTAEALVASVRDSTEDALWNAIRALREEAILTRHMAAHAEAAGDRDGASRLRQAADRAKAAADAVREIDQNANT
jgi:two-component system chemotaxis response regulator CheB